MKKNKTYRLNTFIQTVRQKKNTYTYRQTDKGEKIFLEIEHEV